MIILDTLENGIPSMKISNFTIHKIQLATVCSFETYIFLLVIARATLYLRSCKGWENFHMGFPFCNISFKQNSNDFLLPVDKDL